MIKNELSPPSGYVALKQLNPIHKKVSKSFFSKVLKLVKADFF